MDHFNNPKFKSLIAAIINEYLSKNYTSKDFIVSGNKLFAEIIAIENNPAEFKWYREVKTRYNGQVHKITAASLTKLMKDGGDEPECIDKLNQVMKTAVATIRDLIIKQKPTMKVHWMKVLRSGYRNIKRLRQIQKLHREFLAGLVNWIE